MRRLALGSASGRAVSPDGGRRRLNGRSGRRGAVGRIEGVHDVVVVAGGGSRRMGGRDKLALLDGSGRSLLSAAVAGARATGAGHVVVVGPERPLDLGDVDVGAASVARVTWTIEDPPGGGPVAGIAAGLAMVGTTDVVAVTSGDAPAAAEALPALLDEVTSAGPGAAAVLLDACGRRTLCLAFHRSDAMTALAGLGDPHGSSVRAFLDALDASGVRVVEVPDTWGAAADIDTPDDAARMGWHD